MKVAYAFRRLNDYFTKISTLRNSGIESIESRPDHLSITFHQDIGFDIAREILDSALQNYVDCTYDNLNEDLTLTTFDINFEDDTSIYARIIHCSPGISGDYSILSFDTTLKLEELEQYFDTFNQ